MTINAIRPLLPAAASALLLLAGSAQAQYPAAYPLTYQLPVQTASQAPVAAYGGAASVYPGWTPYVVGNAAASTPITFTSSVAPNQIAAPLYFANALPQYIPPQVQWGYGQPAWPGSLAPSYGLPAYSPLSAAPTYAAAYPASVTGTYPFSYPGSYPAPYAATYAAFPAGYPTAAPYQLATGPSDLFGVNGGFPIEYRYVPLPSEPAPAPEPEPVQLTLPASVVAIPEVVTPMVAPVAPRWGQMLVSAKFALGRAGDSDLSFSSASPTTLATSADGLVGGSLALGYHQPLGSYGFVPGLQVELQASRYRMDLDPTAFGTTGDVGFEQTTGAGFLDSLVEGDETFTGGFANAYFDIALALAEQFSPRAYVGGGIGYGTRKVDLLLQDLIDDSSATPASNATLSRRIEDSGMAYQGMVGLGLDFGRHLGLDVGYKWLKTPKIAAQTFSDGSVSYSIGADNGRILNLVEAGLTVRF